jgi:2-amino-4-hydroxy-6-hydroxymethyldihydropteridine diphosphokinase
MLVRSNWKTVKPTLRRFVPVFLPFRLGKQSSRSICSLIQPGRGSVKKGTEQSPTEPSPTEQPWHRAAIALGSNIGDSVAILESALQTLDQTPGISLAARSPFYLTEPVGPPQPDILNACAILSTQLTPIALLHRLLEIETQFGRVRQEHWGARSLDLDLLLFDNAVINQPTLQIPHPRLTERAFVLVPLSDIAASWIEPVSGRAIVDLLKQVDCSGIKQTVLSNPILSGKRSALKA